MWDFLSRCPLLRCPLYYQGHLGCYKFASGRCASARCASAECFLAPVLVPPVLAISPPYKSPWRGDRLWLQQLEFSPPYSAWRSARQFVPACSVEMQRRSSTAPKPIPRAERSQQRSRGQWGRPHTSLPPKAMASMSDGRRSVPLILALGLDAMTRHQT